METEKKPEKVTHISPKNWITFTEKMISFLREETYFWHQIPNESDEIRFLPYWITEGSFEEGYRFYLHISYHKRDCIRFNRDWKKTLEYWEDWKKKCESILNEYIPELKLISYFSKHMGEDVLHSELELSLIHI